MKAMLFTAMAMGAGGVLLRAFQAMWNCCRAGHRPASHNESDASNQTEKESCHHINPKCSTLSNAYRDVLTRYPCLRCAAGLVATGTPKHDGAE